MAYESNTGLGVNNHYGPRTTGGTSGIVKTEGTYNEYSTSIPITGTADIEFPIINGVHIVGFYIGDAVGTLTALTIGGVNVFTATDAAPIWLASTNTGEVVQTGLTGGELLIKFTRTAVG